MIPRPALVSEAEFLALPESVQKVELLDGEVIVSPSPSLRHQVVLQRIVRALMDWADRQGTPVLIGQAPWDVRFGPDRILQPDAFVVLGPVALDAEGPLDRVPELVVEVLSSNRVHDRVTKRLIYAAAGVREYWVVEPRGPVERWTEEGLSVAEVIDSVLTTPLLPGFSLDLAMLFADRP